MKLVAHPEPPTLEHLKTLCSNLVANVHNVTVVRGDNKITVQHFDYPIAQDIFCKVAEVMQATTAGRFFGKHNAHGLDVYRACVAGIPNSCLKY